MENEAPPCLSEKTLRDTELSAVVLENRIFRIIHYEYIQGERERHHRFCLSAGVLLNTLMPAIKMMRLSSSSGWSRWGQHDWHSFHALITSNSYQRVNPSPAWQCVSRLWQHRHQACFKLPVDSRMNERFNMRKCSLIKGTYLPCPLCVLHPKRSR